MNAGRPVIGYSRCGVPLGVRVGNYAKRDLLASVLALPVMFSSSAFYSAAKAPLYLRLLVYINPLSYCSDAIRLALGSRPVFSSIQMFLLSGLVACSLVISVALTHKSALAANEKWL